MSKVKYTKNNVDYYLVPTSTKITTPSLMLDKTVSIPLFSGTAGELKTVGSDKYLLSSINIGGLRPPIGVVNSGSYPYVVIKYYIGVSHVTSSHTVSVMSGGTMPHNASCWLYYTTSYYMIALESYGFKNSDLKLTITSSNGVSSSWKELDRHASAPNHSICENNPHYPGASPEKKTFSISGNYELTSEGAVIKTGTFTAKPTIYFNSTTTQYATVKLSLE